jgi:hypothetical protein
MKKKIKKADEPHDNKQGFESTSAVEAGDEKLIG